MRSRLLFILTVVLTYNSLAQIPAYVPQGGLQGWWPFTGNANDLSTNNYNGAVTAATLTSDRFGNSNSAYDFDGISSYISTNYTGILGANPRAVSFWSKTTSTITMPAVAWGDNQFIPNGGTRFDCGFSYGGLGATIDGADAAITYNTNTPLNDNKWHHYVFQLGGTLLSQVEVYQDGVLLTSVNNSYMPNTPLNTVNNFNVQFGRIIYNPSYYYVGQLDDIGIWNRTLSLCEIQQLYSSSICTALHETGASPDPSIYPNPTTGAITFHQLPQGATIEIYTQLGQLAYKTISEVENSSIDLGQMPAGIYLAKISSGNYQAFKKVILEDH